MEHPTYKKPRISYPYHEPPTVVIYDNTYVEPDQSLTVNDLLTRHLDISGVSNHESQSVEDVNIDNPLPYDSDLTDIPTRYQDKDYFEYLESRRQSISTSAIDNNPKMLSSNEKVSASSSESMPGNSPSSESS